MLDAYLRQLVAQEACRLEVGEGEFLFHRGDRVKAVFFVAEGQIDLCRHKRDGSTVVLQSSQAQSILAEASIYAEKYHCDALASVSSVVFQMPQATFHSQLRDNNDFAVAWAAHLAHEVQLARSRIEVLSHNTVAKRLDCWLASPENKLPRKGDWKELASQIGVSPEALYRELKKR
jgi:CRP-like cAMP-binding protein